MTNSLIAPLTIRSYVPLTEKSRSFLSVTQNELFSIFQGLSSKKILIVGPCSIHHLEGALTYGKKLFELQKKVAQEILILMRVHIEKPRTKDDWRGFVYDPYLNQTHDIHAGILQSRGLMTKLIEMGVPIATEILDPNLVPYFQDCYAFATIGARTISSPTHRLIASDLKCPVGFKNRIDGDILSAIEATKMSKNSQQILHIGDDGMLKTKKTTGNLHGSLILRGSLNQPNYGLETIKTAQSLMIENNCKPHVIIDCSHGNSLKESQSEVFKKVAQDLIEHQSHILGMMLESYLQAGKYRGQDLTLAPSDISITDPCICFEETEDLILDFHSKLIKSNHSRCLKLATSSPSNVVKSAL